MDRIAVFGFGSAELLLVDLETLRNVHDDALGDATRKAVAIAAERGLTLGRLLEVSKVYAPDHWEYEPTLCASAPVIKHLVSDGPTVHGFVEAVFELGPEKRPSRCPECGAGTVVPIAYGLPSDEMWEMVERGEIVLGGCVTSSTNPLWFCKTCEHVWGPEGD